MDTVFLRHHFPSSLPLSILLPPWGGDHNRKNTSTSTSIITSTGKITTTSKSKITTTTTTTTTTTINGYGDATVNFILKEKNTVIDTEEGSTRKNEGGRKSRGRIPIDETIRRGGIRRSTRGRNGKSVSDRYKNMAMKNETRVGVKT